MPRRTGFLLALLFILVAAAGVFLPRSGRPDRAPPPRPVERPAAPAPPIAEDPRPAPPVPPPAAAQPEALDCALSISLRNARTNEPAAGAVRLWRLDVPERDGWTAGDSLERKVDVREEGLVVEGLPAGLYRAQVVSQAADALDPPEFLVGGTWTAVTLPVEFPRYVRVTLRIVDEEGRPIEEAECERGAESANTVEAPPPTWAKPRERPFGGRAGVSIASASVSVAMRQKTGRAIAVDGAFDLGTVKGDTRGTRTTRPFTFVIPGRARVTAAAKGAYGADTVLIAVAPLLAVAGESAVLPHGLPALEAGANVGAVCEAVPEPADFRQIPVRVQIVLGGYAPLSFAWKAGDPASRRVLTPGD